MTTAEVMTVALPSEAAGVERVAQRRGNSRDPLTPWVSYLCDRMRRRIETAFSGRRWRAAATPSPRAASS